MQLSESAETVGWLFLALLTAAAVCAGVLELALIILSW